jgi:apolipoprotein D and lipocalin family protein
MHSIRIALALSLAAIAGCSSGPPLPALDVAPTVDLSRFQGQWFEIAKLPRATQASCTGTTAFYVLRDNGLDVTNQCRVGSLDGSLRTSLQRVDAGDSGSAKLSLEVAGFVGDYWILEVGQDYEYAVIGVPSRDYLWILSRTPTFDAVVLEGIVQRMKASQFETSKLDYTAQWTSDNAPTGPVGGPLTPTTYGCAVSGAAPGAAPWVALVGLGLLLSRRRRRS